MKFVGGIVKSTKHKGRVFFRNIEKIVDRQVYHPEVSLNDVTSYNNVAQIVLYMSQD